MTKVIVLDQGDYAWPGWLCLTRVIMLDQGDYAWPGWLCLTRVIMLDQGDYAWPGWLCITRVIMHDQGDYAWSGWLCLIRVIILDQGDYSWPGWLCMTRVIILDQGDYAWPGWLCMTRAIMLDTVPGNLLFWNKTNKRKITKIHSLLSLPCEKVKTDYHNEDHIGLYTHCCNNAIAIVCICLLLSVASRPLCWTGGCCVHLRHLEVQTASYLQKQKP